MPRSPLSPPWCFRCGRDEEDGVHLLAVHLARSYTDPAGTRRTSTIPMRVCKPCAQLAIEASGRVRGDWLARSRPAARIRNSEGRYASGAASRDA